MVSQLVKLANDKVTNIRRLVGRCVVRLRERKGFNGQVTVNFLPFSLHKNFFSVFLHVAGAWYEGDERV